MGNEILLTLESARMTPVLDGNIDLATLAGEAIFAFTPIQMEQMPLVTVINEPSKEQSPASTAGGEPLWKMPESNAY